MTVLNLMKMEEFSKRVENTWGNGQKLLITSNFSFSYTVFDRLILQIHKSKGHMAKIFYFRIIPIADNKSNMAEIMTFTSEKVENKLEWRQCWLPALSPFLTMFSKGFFIVL